ncbi:MAG: HAMP domain-containing histidine kinase [Sandaracinaceae bacterium]|nr:HAMP domain-containing histidine kinase [Sandaracinaceae bacterium]
MSNVVPIEVARPNGQAGAPEFNLRVLTCLGRFLAETNPSALERVTRAAGLEPTALDGKTRWVSHQTVEAVLAAARSEMASDEELFKACLYKYAESHGLIRYLVMLASPLQAYERGAQMFDLASRVSEFKTIRQDAHRIRMIYTSERPESRLMCLSRMSALVVTPTLWGLPRARIDERKCIAHGDDCCEYEVSFYSHVRWISVLWGALAGGAIATTLVLLDQSWATGLALPVLGGLVGYLRELRVVHRFNVDMGVRAQELLREVARDDAEARAELLELHARQAEWTRVTEEQLAERSAALEKVTERITWFRTSTQTTLRGLSHDMRNPLQVLTAESALLRMLFERAGLPVPDILDDHDAAVHKIERLLAELMNFVTSERTAGRFKPEELIIGRLSDRLRRQIRALTLGKNIRTSVFTVREAPEKIVADSMVLDRVLDNILTNAAKYTEEGSIVVEVGGTPGMLTVKVSDTGRGIEPERIERIFDGRPSEGRRPGSFGVGLSVVIELLRQIGGSLEIMSKHAVGTTVWIHVPVAPAEDHSAVRDSRRPVLSIRRSSP